MLNRFNQTPFALFENELNEVKKESLKENLQENSKLQKDLSNVFYPTKQNPKSVYLDDSFFGESFGFKKFKKDAFSDTQTNISSFLSGFSNNFTANIYRDLKGLAIDASSFYGGDKIISKEEAKKKWDINTDRPVTSAYLNYIQSNKNLKDNLQYTTQLGISESKLLDSDNQKYLPIFSNLVGSFADPVLIGGAIILGSNIVAGTGFISKYDKLRKSTNLLISGSLNSAFDSYLEYNFQRNQILEGSQEKYDYENIALWGIAGAIIGGLLVNSNLRINRKSSKKVKETLALPPSRKYSVIYQGPNKDLKYRMEKFYNDAGDLKEQIKNKTPDSLKRIKDLDSLEKQLKGKYLKHESEIDQFIIKLENGLGITKKNKEYLKKVNVYKKEYLEKLKFYFENNNVLSEVKNINQDNIKNLFKNKTDSINSFYKRFNNKLISYSSLDDISEFLNKNKLKELYNNFLDSPKLEIIEDTFNKKYLTSFEIGKKEFLSDIEGIKALINDKVSWSVLNSERIRNLFKLNQDISLFDVSTMDEFFKHFKERVNNADEFIKRNSNLYKKYIYNDGNIDPSIYDKISKNDFIKLFGLETQKLVNPTKKFLEENFNKVKDKGLSSLNILKKESIDKITKYKNSIINKSTVDSEKVIDDALDLFSKLKGKEDFDISNILNLFKKETKVDDFINADDLFLKTLKEAPIENKLYSILKRKNSSYSYSSYKRIKNSLFNFHNEFTTSFTENLKKFVNKIENISDEQYSNIVKDITVHYKKLDAIHDFVLNRRDSIIKSPNSSNKKFIEAFKFFKEDIHIRVIRRELEKIENILFKKRSGYNEGFLKDTNLKSFNITYSEHLKSIKAFDEVIEKLEKDHINDRQRKNIFKFFKKFKGEKGSFPIGLKPVNTEKVQKFLEKQSPSLNKMGKWKDETFIPLINSDLRKILKDLKKEFNLKKGKN